MGSLTSMMCSKKLKPFLKLTMDQEGSGFKAAFVLLWLRSMIPSHCFADPLARGLTYIRFTRVLANQ